MFVVAGTASQRLARSVAEGLGAALILPEVRQFPDGEVYARVSGSELDGADVAVVQTTLGNDRLVELLLLLDAVRGQDANRVVAVVPYYAYARQDRRFQAGESLSAEVTAKAIGLYADHLITVDPHKEHILDFFPGVGVGVSAVPEMAAHFQRLGVDLVLAPDKGARHLAREAAEVIGCPYDHLEKTRLSSDQVVMAPKNLNAKGRTVAIIDDIISTGGTMATATAQLREQGAAAVDCAATHGLFTGGAVERLTKAGVRSVVATDTIHSPQSVVSAAPAILRGLERALGVKASVDA